MNRINITIILLCLLFASCGGDKEYYEIPPGPDGNPIEAPGQITVPEDLPLPDDGGVTIIDEDGNEKEVEPGQSVDVEAGEYQLVVTENNTGMTIAGTKASIAAMADGLLPALPALLADVVTVKVYEGKVTIPKINLRPMTREVQLRLKITNAAPGSIAGIKATLNGVANALDLSKGFGAVSADGNYHATAGINGHTIENVINLRLLGIAPGADLQLLFEVTSTGGGTNKLLLDVNEPLRSFNSGSASAPAIINASLQLGPEGMTGIIESWNNGGEVEIDGE